MYREISESEYESESEANIRSLLSDNQSLPPTPLPLTPSILSSPLLLYEIS